MAAKPVPQMITSASCSRPSSVRIPLRLDPADRVGDHVDVVAVERRVPLAGEQHPLAAEVVVGTSRRRSSGSRTCRRSCTPPARLHGGQHRPADPGLALQGGVEQLGDPEDQPPLGAQQRREPVEQPGGGRGRYAASGFGTTYGAERWNTVSDPTRSTIAGHELDRAGAGADDRDPLAVERHVVAPLRGVERRAGERVDARGTGGSPAGRAGRPPRPGPRRRTSCRRRCARARCRSVRRTAPPSPPDRCGPGRAVPRRRRPARGRRGSRRWPAQRRPQAGLSAQDQE